MKCFTVLSHLNKMYRDMKFDLKQLNVKIELPENSNSFDNYRECSISLHGANTLPNMIDDETISLIYEIENRISYNRISTELLDSRYDTNCYEYDLDYKFANFNMRSDCIELCIEEFILEDCNENSFISTGYPLRTELLEQEFYSNKYKAAKLFGMP